MGFFDYFGGGQLGGGLGGGMPYNTMAGLGMGLMGGTISNPYGAAMAGFQAGANADAQNAYRMALLKDRESDNAFRRSESARSQANADRLFAENQRQFNEARNPKPTIVQKEDMYGNPKFYLENPAAGTVQEITPEQMKSLGPAVNSGQINMSQAVVPGVNSSMSPNDADAIPPNASLAQGAALPQPPANTNQREWIKHYSGAAGTEAAKAQAKQEAERRARENSPATDIVMEDADRAIGMATKSPMTTTGLGGQVLSNVGGTQAHDLSQLLSGIKANISFDKLQNMRANSPTGGALGNVSDKDMALLQATLGSVEQSQSKDQFVKNMERLKKVYYETIHGPNSYSGGGGGGAGGDYPRVKSPTEALKLPRGSKFLDPDGNLRTVP